MKRDLHRLASNEYDLLIIGGGVYGLFVAWDAAIRGLAVALVDKGDFGHATSSNTLRIIHGGLRYLQHGDLRRMRQSIRERSVFMRIAPHLVHPLPFFIPAYGHLLRGKEILSLALKANDIMGFDRNRLSDPGKTLPSGRVLSREEAVRLFPSIQTKGLTGGGIVYDCQISDSERLIFSVARSAARAGADLANYVEVIGFLTRGHRVAGVMARDTLGGGRLDIRAKVVVNTSGPWANRVLELLDGPRAVPRLGLSKAFNLLVDRQLVSGYAVGAYSQKHFRDREAILSKGSRLLFITPWQNRSLIGTVHLPYDGDPDSLKVTEAEVQDFVDEINAAYPAAALTRQDAVFVYGGLLPRTMTADGTNEVQLLKRHQIHDHKNGQGLEGLISVIGVKFTEARYVAEGAVDLAFRKLGKVPPGARTAVTPIYGGQIEQFDAFVRQEVERGGRMLSKEAIRYLIRQYGSAYPEVLKYLDQDLGADRRIPVPRETGFPPSLSRDKHPSSSSSSQRGAAQRHRATEGEAESLFTSFSLLKAQVLHGIHEEMAQKLCDVVFRRTSRAITPSPGALSLVTCADIMARELGWDKTRTECELAEVKAAFPASM